MSFLAANPVGLSYLSPCLVERANASLSTRNDGGEWHLAYGGHAGSNRTAIAASFRSQCTDENFALERVCRYVSRLMLSHRSGAFPAPCGARSSASRSAPLRGLGSSQNKFANRAAQTAAQTSFGPLPESRPSALGSRAHSLGFARCDPSNNGKFNNRRHDYVPEQSNPHRLCRQQPRSSH